MHLSTGSSLDVLSDLDTLGVTTTRPWQWRQAISPPVPCGHPTPRHRTSVPIHHSQRPRPRPRRRSHNRRPTQNPGQLSRARGQIRQSASRSSLPPLTPGRPISPSPRLLYPLHHQKRQAPPLSVSPSLSRWRASLRLRVRLARPISRRSPRPRLHTISFRASQPTPAR